MLSRRILSGALALALPILGTAEQATAQFYSGGCSGCGTAMPVAQTAMAAECMPVQPVVATCYQTVPVTTYAREKQTVEVPYYKTEYEEREVTVMRPVTRQREVEVPTVSYQNVTEMRTMTRDAGRWVTNYQPVQKCSPCQVDPRPGMIGWLNRTGYSFRSAMTPSYTTSRQYVPNMVTCNVPVTRQVAVQGTRRVTVSETEMVAERKTEKVAVQRLAYRKEDVTVMRAQTAYRTVPIGTSMAYGGGYSTQSAYYPYGAGSAMAFGYPIIESSPSRTAQAPCPTTLVVGEVLTGLSHSLLTMTRRVQAATVSKEMTVHLQLVLLSVVMTIPKQTRKKHFFRIRRLEESVTRESLPQKKNVKTQQSPDRRAVPDGERLAAVQIASCLEVVSPEVESTHLDSHLPKSILRNNS